MKTSSTIEISRDPASGFECTTQHVAEWSTIVVSDEMASEGPLGVGATFRAITEDLGSEMVFDGGVIQHWLPEIHAVGMEGKQFDMEVENNPREPSRSRGWQVEGIDRRFLADAGNE